MIEIVLGPEALGSVRFAFSPLAEVATSLRLLGASAHHHVNAPWVTAVRDRTANLDLELLSAIAPPGQWAPDFFFPLPTGPADLDRQLTALSTLPPDRVRTDLEQVWSDRPMPPRLARELQHDPARLLERVAAAVRDYWHVALAPFWARMRGVLEDDIAHRASRSMSSGLTDLLAGLHRDVSVAEHRVRIDSPWPRDEVLSGSSLVLVPSVFVWPRMVLAHHADEPDRSQGDVITLTYAARGVGGLWSDADPRDDTENHLAALLGRTRARILTALTVPCTTTYLARSLAQSPGSVSMHLSVLHNGGLVDRRRVGRSVLYRRTALGTSVVSVCRTSTSPAAAVGDE